MNASIIICTHNRVASLRETLASLQATIARTDPCEILLVDNGSTDTTSQECQRFAAESGLTVRCLVEPTKGKSRALNLAMARAHGDVFLFTDDDVRFPSNWMRSMCEPLVNGIADLVQGGIAWAPGLLNRCSEPYVMAAITSTAHKSASELETALIGANMAFSRKVYEALGNFDEELGPGALGLAEETLYGWRALDLGFRKCNALDVVVEHHFDSDRLNRRGILSIADRKGRSAAYIDHHYKQVSLSCPLLRFIAVWAKDAVRTLCSPPSWSSQRIPPQWKFSYRASQSYFQQMSREQRCTRSAGRNPTRLRKAQVPAASR